MRSITHLIIVSLLLAACTQGGTQTRSLSIATEGTQSLDLSLEVSGKVGALAATADAEQLLQAELAHVGELVVDDTGGADRVLVIREEGLSNAAEIEEPLTWDVTVANSVPLALRLDINAGSFTGTLTDLQMTSLAITNNAAQATFDLPQTAADYPVTVVSNAGSMTISVPDGSGAKLQSVDSNATALTLNLGHDLAFDADIEVTSGTLTVNAPQDLGLRVFADATVGNVTVPATFVQTARNDSFIGAGTTYESPNLAAASSQVTLRISVTAGTVEIRQQ